MSGKAESRLSQILGANDRPTRKEPAARSKARTGGQRPKLEKPEARRVAQVAAATDEHNIESNLGVVGLGGTGVRVSSSIFRADRSAPGLGHSYGFDLDADEVVPVDSRNYTYTLVQQTGGIPAAGIFSFSEMIGDRLLAADIADLDRTAATYQATVRRVVESSLYNVTVPILSAGGGVGHGLFRSIHKAIPRGRTLTVPLIVQPSSRQALPIKVSAAAAAGRFLASGEHPVVLVAENDLLEGDRARLRGRRFRNAPLGRAVRITGAAIDEAFHHQEADGNIDRALLNFARGATPRVATLGTAAVPCLGNGDASLVEAVRRAVANPLAHVEGHPRRIMVFATVPRRMDVEAARSVLEASAFNARESGYELTGAFLGRTTSYSVDAAVWIAGDIRPRFLDETFHAYSPEQLTAEVDHKVRSGRLKLEKALGAKGIGKLVHEVDPEPYLQSAHDDMTAGLSWLREGVIA